MCVHKSKAGVLIGITYVSGSEAASMNTYESKGGFPGPEMEPNARTDEGLKSY